MFMKVRIGTQKMAKYTLPYRSRQDSISDRASLHAQLCFNQTLVLSFSHIGRKTFESVLPRSQCKIEVSLKALSLQFM